MIKPLVLTFVGAALGALSIAHAASEAFPYTLGQQFDSPTSLTANANARYVDRASRTWVAEQLVAEQSGQRASFPEDLVERAKRSFAVDPAHASTIRAVAVGYTAPRSETAGRKAMELAWQVDKRDLTNTLWLAQQHGRDADIGGMVQLLDAALRTRRLARDTAITPLLNAMVYPESHSLIADLLARNPDWEGAFWEEFVDNQIAISNADAFFANTSAELSDIEPAGRLRIYSNLQRLGDFQTLVELANAEVRGGIREPGRGAEFRRDATNPFGWRYFSNGDFSTRVTGPNNLEIESLSGSFGVVAERLVKLDGLSSMSIATQGLVPEGGRLKFELHCVSPQDTVLATMLLTADAARSSAEIAVQNCAIAAASIAIDSSELSSSAGTYEIAEIAWR